MLKSILKKLNGHVAEPPSLAEALEQLGRDREAVIAEIDTLNAKRKQALLDDADDKTLDAIERRIDRLTIQLEKLTVAEQPLRDQLAIADEAERRRRWKLHRDEHATVAAEYLTAARATAAAHSRLVKVMNRARVEGFDREAMAYFPITPNVAGNAVCAPDLLDAFECALSPPVPTPHVAAAASRLAAPAPKPVTDGSNVAIDSHGLLAVVPLKPANLPKAAPDDRSPLKSGHRRVIVLQEGYQGPDGLYSKAGRVLQLPDDIAIAAGKSGAIEFVNEEVRP